MPPINTILNVSLVPSTMTVVMLSSRFTKHFWFSHNSLDHNPDKSEFITGSPAGLNLARVITSHGSTTPAKFGWDRTSGGAATWW